MFEPIDLFANKNILMLGYGLSGKSCCKFLRNLKHKVFVFDDDNRNIAGENVIQLDDVPKMDLIVKSPAIPIMPHNRHPAIDLAERHNIQIVSTFDIFALANPEARMVCITGTNGKSTVTALTHHILRNARMDVQMGGNIGIPYFDMPKAEIYILEMSSYELASSKFLNFEIGCILNIEPDHLEFHGSFEEYVIAKHRALERAKLRIISAEDRLSLAKFPDAIQLAAKPMPEVYAHIFEDKLIDSAGNAALNLSASLLFGEHNHQNIAFAHTICRNLGLESAEIAQHVATFRPLPHRLSKVGQMGNVLFVNDSKATNPESAAWALRAFGKNNGHKIFWLAGGRSKKIDPLAAVEDCLEYVQKIYLFGEAAAEFCAVFGNLKQVVVCETMAEALKLAYSDAASHDGQAVVLLAPMCASFDQFDGFEHRGREFERIVTDIIQQ